MAKKNTRPDHDGTHRKEFERNRKIILETQDVCGICGRPVDKSLRYPHPMSATVDHIIPVSHGGHPSAISNLQGQVGQGNSRRKAEIREKSSDQQPRFTAVDGLENVPRSVVGDTSPSPGAPGLHAVTVNISR